MLRADRIASAVWLFTLKHRVATLLTVALVCLAAMSGARYLQFSMDYHIFFSGHDPHLSEYERQQNTYSKNDNVLIAIEPSAATVFNYPFLKVLRRYTHEAWLLPEVTRVDSLTNFQDSFAQDNQLVIQDLVSEDVDFSEALIRYVEKVSLSEPVLVNRLVSENGQYTAIALTINLPDGPEKNNRIIELVKAVRILAEKLQNEAEVKKVYLSGTVMINNAFYEVSKHDLITLMPLMFAVIIVFLSVLIRSFTASLIVFMKVGVSVGVSFGLGSALGIQLTPPAVAAAPIIMMLAIADSVHLLTQYQKNVYASDTQGDRLAAMGKSLNTNFAPITLTSITTIIGFLTMNFSESPPFHDLGNLVSIGAFVAWLLTVLVLPQLVVLLPVPPKASTQRVSRVMTTLANSIVRHGTPLAVAVMLVFGGLLYATSRNELNDEFIKYFDHSVEFRRDNDFITQNLTGVYQIEYSLPAEGENGINEPEYLLALDKFAAWFRQQEHVLHVQSVVDLYKKGHMNLHDGRIDEYRIPETRDLAAQALLAYELSLPVGLDLNDQIDVAKSKSKFVVSLRTISAKELIAVETKADMWLREHAPASMSSAVGTGPAVLFAHIGMKSIRAGLLGGVIALLLICCLVSLMYASLRMGLISLIPNLFPAAMAFGVWGLSYGKINMALATVLSMTLGIIVDDTIHFISRYRRFRDEGLSPEECVRRTFATVGSAIVITTLVLVSGFLVLTASPFIMNWGMGLLSSLTILFALLTDLILLPLALMKFERSNEKVFVAPVSAAVD